jgi:hypothetical protein
MLEGWKNGKLEGWKENNLSIPMQIFERIQVSPGK